MADIDGGAVNTITDGDYYYAHDHLYSPAALFDESGNVVERYEYSAYGEAVILDSDFDIRASSLYANAYAFTGRRLDALDGGDLNLMYYRARTYDPQTGRFMQRDPFKYTDGMNLYVYVASNPIRLIDPMGLCKKDSCYIIRKTWPVVDGRIEFYGGPNLHTAGLITSINLAALADGMVGITAGIAAQILAEFPSLDRFFWLKAQASWTERTVKTYAYCNKCGQYESSSYVRIQSDKKHEGDEVGGSMDDIGIIGLEELLFKTVDSLIEKAGRSVPNNRIPATEKEILPGECWQYIGLGLPPVPPLIY